MSHPMLARRVLQFEGLHNGAIGGARDSEDSEQDAGEQLKATHFLYLKASAPLVKQLSGVAEVSKRHPAAPPRLNRGRHARQRRSGGAWCAVPISGIP